MQWKQGLTVSGTMTKEPAADSTNDGRTSRTSFESEAASLVVDLRRRPSTGDAERTSVRASTAKIFMVLRERNAIECRGELAAFCGHFQAMHREERRHSSRVPRLKITWWFCECSTVRFRSWLGSDWRKMSFAAFNSVRQTLIGSSVSQGGGSSRQSFGAGPKGAIA